MSKRNLGGKPPLNETPIEPFVSQSNMSPAGSSSPDGTTGRRAVAHDGVTMSEVRDTRIRAVLTIIRNERGYSVGELASKVHLTRSQLQRLFKRQTGAVIGDFLVEQRLQRAAHLLSTSDLSIKEIAYTVGYEHHSSFTRAFANWFAQSPRDYRQKSLSERLEPLSHDDIWTDLWDAEHLDWSTIHVISHHFDGETVESLNVCIDLVERFSSKLQPTSYDSAWPILETWEQLARRAALKPELTALFVKRYVAILLQSGAILRALMTWGVNELLERRLEHDLGWEIAIRLKDVPKSDRVVWRVISALKAFHKELRGPEFNEGRDAQRADFASLENRAKQEIPNWLSTECKEDLVTSYDAWKTLVSYWNNARLGDSMGIMAMATVKSALTSLSEVSRKQPGAVLRACESILRLVDRNADFSCLCAIESLEGVRDRFPGLCGEVMGNFLGTVNRRDLAFGIGVCITEGYEENAEVKPGMRFVPRSDKWTCTLKYAYPTRKRVPKLDSFFIAAIDSFNREDRPAFLREIPEWINGRLDLHPTMLAN